jgi:hypothetical protein
MRHSSTQKQKQSARCHHTLLLLIAARTRELWGCDSVSVGSSDFAVIVGA